MLSLSISSLALQAGRFGPPTTCRAAPAVMALEDGIVNVGVIGAGRIGIVHLEALAQCETANAVIISNPTISKAEAAAEKYKAVSYTHLTLPTKRIV